MAVNTELLGGLASLIALATEASFIDASGYKFPEKDNRPTKIKVKRASQKNGKATKDNNQIDSSKEDVSREPTSPILPEMDDKAMALFPTGKPRETTLDTIICKHCKRAVLKAAGAEHIRGCLRAKQEKARKKKEARDAANKAKEKDKAKDEDANGVEDVGDMKGQKSSKKSMGEDGTAKKSKKRKTEGEADKEPKKKKKKEEAKKPAKPKGPVDVERQCGVTLPNGGQCARSLTCKSHSMGAKRAVPGRSLPYDMLLQAYQKKNQARQQKAAIDANAPVHDDADPNCPIDSDEEKDAVMAGIARSQPIPLATHPLISTRKKYHLVRMKGMLSQALGGTRGAGLFSFNGEAGTMFGTANPFQTDSPAAGFSGPVGVADRMDNQALPSPDAMRRPSFQNSSVNNHPQMSTTVAMKKAVPTNNSMT